MTNDDTQQKVTKEQAQYLMKLKSDFESKQSYAASRKDRLEKLMQRNSANKWKPKKVAKMVRRLSNSKNELEQSTSILENVNHKLSQYHSQEG